MSNVYRLHFLSEKRKNTHSNKDERVDMIRFGRRPSHLGVREGKLATCPSSPNCVSSQSDLSKSKIDPISYQGSQQQAMHRLKSILCSMERTTLIQETEDYLYLEIVMRFIRCVDDIEFYFDDEAKLIHVRSSSRVGYSDWSANRKRVEWIRKEFFS